MDAEFRERYRRDRPLDPWSHVRLWLSTGGGMLLLHGLSQDPVWVEQVYVRGFGTEIARWLTWLSSPVPLSLAEIALGVWIVVEALRLLETVAQIGAGRRTGVNASMAGLLHVVDVAMVMGLWFLVAWGVSYGRPPASMRYGLDVVPLSGDLTPAQLASLEADVLRLTDAVNASYRALHGRDDAGEVTVPRAGLDVDAALEHGFARLGPVLGEGDAFGAPRGPAKVPFGSMVLSNVGVSGVYVPFTGEATINGDPPAWSVVASLAHEKAHQRMIASEDEATFVGTLAMLHADDPLLTYVAWQTMRRRLQARLVVSDPDALERLQGKLAPGPQRDIIAVTGFWENYFGPLQDAHRAVNDTYLRANGIEDGVAAYARAADLFSAWLRTPAGKALGGAG